MRYTDLKPFSRILICVSFFVITHSLIYRGESRNQKLWFERADYNSCTVQRYTKLLGEGPLECVAKCARNRDCGHVIYCPESKSCYVESESESWVSSEECECFQSKDARVKQLSPSGQCEASSEYRLGSDYPCYKAIDGISSSDFDNAWASVGEGVGAWIKIYFQKPITLAHVRIMQRPKIEERNKDVELLFSDGSIQMIKFPYHAEQGYFWDEIKVNTVRTSWVKLTIRTVYSTHYNGWKELEFYGMD